MPVLDRSKNDAQIERASSRKKQRRLTFSYTVIVAVTLSVVALCSPSVGLTAVRIGNVHAGQNGATAVPVMIYHAADLGSIDLELTFNPAVVAVPAITAGDFDVTVTNLEKSATGFVKIVAFQTTNPGLNGTVVLAQVTLGAVGPVNSTSPLNITVCRMTDATPLCCNHSYSITNGSFSVLPSAEPTPTSTPSPESGGGGQFFAASVDSDGDGYSDHYEHLTGSDPHNPCDPDPTCSACLAPRAELLPVVATSGESPRSTPVPPVTKSRPVPTIEPAPPSSVPEPAPVLEVLQPPETLMLILIAAILLSGLLMLAISRSRRKKRE
ncbi:MAG: hypothetical protein ACP5E9_04380 [Candidatus Methanospirareceae archaeon]